jgi:hypothetical protein
MVAMGDPKVTPDWPAKWLPGKLLLSSHARKSGQIHQESRLFSSDS